MLKQNKSNFKNDEIPENVKENLAVGEKILHSINWVYIPLRYKIMKYTVIGFIPIFILIYVILLPNKVSHFQEYSLIFYIVMPLGLVMMMFMTRILNKYYYSLVITNKKLYLKKKVFKLENLYSVDLSAIKGIGNKSKVTRTGQIKNKLLLLSNELPVFLNGVIEVELLEDSQFHFNKTESILWEFGNIGQRWEKLVHQHNIKLPFKIKSSELLRARLKRSIKKYNISMICFFSMVIIGILLLITINNLDNILILAMSLFLIMFGAILLYIFYILKLRISKIIPKQITDIILKEKEIIFERESRIDAIRFQENIPFLNFIITPDLKSRINEKMDNMGMLIVKPEINSSIEFTFGPIDKFESFFEIFFLYYLKLKNKSNLSSIVISNSEISLPKEVHTPIRNFELMSSEIKLQNDIYQSIQKYLDPEEKVVFKYKPDIHLIKYIIFGIIGIVSFIGLYFVISLSFRLDSLNLMILGLFTLTFPIGGGCLSLVILSGMVTEKRSLYIFTSQKIIITHPKRTLFIKYSNITNLLKIKRIGSKHNIEMNLKYPLENSPFVDKNKITILSIPNKSDLIEKIKLIKDTYS